MHDLAPKVQTQRREKDIEREREVDFVYVVSDIFHLFKLVFSYFTKKI